MLPIDYLSGAYRDFDDSFDWHFERSAQAAIRFADAVDASLLQVAAEPTRSVGADGVHRECPVKKSPFRIVYRLAENRVLNAEFAHGTRTAINYSTEPCRTTAYFPRPR